MYICQFPVPNSSLPPSPPSLGPMFVLYLCVSISALQIDSLVPVLEIPHICVNIQYLFFYFWLTSLCMTCPRSGYISANGFTPFFSDGWRVFHHILCICVPHLYWSLCQRTFRLFSYQSLAPHFPFALVPQGFLSLSLPLRSLECKSSIVQEKY